MDRSACLCQILQGSWIWNMAASGAKHCRTSASRTLGGANALMLRTSNPDDALGLLAECRVVGSFSGASMEPVSLRQALTFPGGLARTRTYLVLRSAVPRVNLSSMGGRKMQHVAHPSHRQLVAQVLSSARFLFPPPAACGAGVATVNLLCKVVDARGKKPWPLRFCSLIAPSDSCSKVGCIVAARWLDLDWILTGSCLDLDLDWLFTGSQVDLDWMLTGA